LKKILNDGIALKNSSIGVKTETKDKLRNPRNLLKNEHFDIEFCQFGYNSWGIIDLENWFFQKKSSNSKKISCFPSI
jgi:hypothetical protein